MRKLQYIKRNGKSTTYCPYGMPYKKGDGLLNRIGSIGCRMCKYFHSENKTDIDGDSINCLGDLYKKELENVPMGYYTKHIVRLLPAEYATKEHYKTLATLIEDNSGYGDWTYTGRGISDRKWNSGDGCKWYNLEKDMEIVSVAFPEFTIEIDCIGEGYYYPYDEDYYDPPFAYRFERGNMEYVEFDDELKAFDDEAFLAEYKIEGEVFNETKEN